MFRALSAHLQEDTVVYMQHMAMSLSTRVPGGLSVYSLSENSHSLTWVLTQAVYRQATRNSHREWEYHMLRVYNCILLKMSTWGSKHVEEKNTLWINNNQCIKLVINIQEPICSMRIDRRRDRHDESNSRFSQFCEKRLAIKIDVN